MLLIVILRFYISFIKWFIVEFDVINSFFETENLSFITKIDVPIINKFIKFGKFWNYERLIHHFNLFKN